MSDGTERALREALEGISEVTWTDETGSDAAQCMVDDALEALAAHPVEPEPLLRTKWMFAAEAWLGDSASHETGDEDGVDGIVCSHCDALLYGYGEGFEPDDHGPDCPVPLIEFLRDALLAHPVEGASEPKLQRCQNLKAQLDVRLDVHRRYMSEPHHPDMQRVGAGMLDEAHRRFGAALALEWPLPATPSEAVPEPGQDYPFNENQVTLVRLAAEGVDQPDRGVLLVTADRMEDIRGLPAVPDIKAYAEHLETVIISAYEKRYPDGACVGATLALQRILAAPESQSPEQGETVAWRKRVPHSAVRGKMGYWQLHTDEPDALVGDEVQALVVRSPTGATE